MKVSTKGRYGLRIMVELAAKYGDGPLSLREIADSQQISYKYLEQLVPPLKQEDLIRSFQGSKGGYSLTKKPEDINVLEVVRTLEGPLSPAECVEDPDLCKRYQSCVTRELWMDVDESIKESLSSKTLKELAEKKAEEN